MKYLKTYEKVNRFGYEADENTVYVYEYQLKFDYCLIGKFHNNGYFIKGYDLDDYLNNNNITDDHKFVPNKDFKNVREATPEETEMFEIMDAQKKYNL